jgi:hypothetical protein
LELFIVENIHVRLRIYFYRFFRCFSVVWNYGDTASDGLKQVAEWGAIGTMQKEIKNHVNFCLIVNFNHSFY